MQIIGQTELKNKITTCIDNNELPKFIIIEGQEGSGRRTIAKFIAKLLCCPYTEFSTKVEDIRSLISLCYSQTSPIVYCIANGENLSLNAKNALLKVAEEPPKFATIILTTTGSGMIDTIRSRAVTFTMQPYSEKQLEKYITDNGLHNDILKLANNIGECNELSTINITEINDLVDNIITNIHRATIGNCLKLTSKFALKDDTVGINIKYFVRAFSYKLVEKTLKAKDIKEASAYNKLLEALYKANRELSTGYNKSSIMDNLFLTAKEVLDGII